MTPKPSECPLCQARLRDSTLASLGSHFASCPRTDWVQRGRRS